MSNFHVHSDYSFRDSIQSVKEIAEYQKSIGKDWFCITDHGTMAAFPDIENVAKELNMRAFYGCEFYVVPEEDKDEKVRIKKLAEAKSAKDADLIKKYSSYKGLNYYHITVIAYNQTGLDNLIKINNSSDNFYKKHRVYIEDILKYNEGLVLLTGCPAGSLFNKLFNGEIDKARDYLKQLKEVYENRLYYELMYHDGIDLLERNEIESEEDYRDRCRQEEKAVYIKGIQLAIDLGISIVATNDSHYTTPDQRDYWVITRKAFSPKIETVGDYHMMPDNKFFAEVYSNYVTEDELDASEEEIVSLLESNITIPRSNYLNTKEDDIEFERIVWNGFKRFRVGTEFEEQSLREIPYQLSVITTKGFSKYFLIVRNLIKASAEKGVMTGPGRGSGAGSECTYLSGITYVDPLKYQLVFERFLNPGRNALPDIDVDFESQSCENFEPTDEYQAMIDRKFKVDITDDEIREYWRRYNEIKGDDHRREDVFAFAGKECYNCATFDI